MNLDDILALASDRSVSQLERARARRATRRVQQEYQRAVSERRDLLGDIDVRDPLDGEVDEAARIGRAAQLAKLGTLTWVRTAEEMTWSDEMSLIFGFPPGTVRPAVRLLSRLIHPDDAAEVRRTVESVWREQTVKETTFRVVRPDRVTRYVHCYVEFVVDADNRPHGIVATGQDITEVELARQERVRLARRRETVLTELAGRDPVTGLLSRQRFADEIDSARRGGSGVLLVVAVEPASPAAGVGPVGADPDDTGPDDQDRLASAVATVVRRAARRSDVCGRTGFGEFGVLLHRTTLDAATGLAESIVENIRAQTFVVGQTPLRLDARGGLVRYQGRDETRGIDLLADAETAWRRASSSGVPCVALEQPAPADERREVCRNRVRTYLADNRLTLYTQPILDLRLNQITRQEILLRVNDGGTTYSASTLLGEAERIDEVLPIDRWVIDRTMELIARGAPTSHYQVNLSSRSLGDPHLLEHVQRGLLRYDVDPGQLTFEITETARIANLTEAHNFAHGIREIGCQLALDDFGSGYVPFAFLTYFPVDLVKVGGEFISGIQESAANRTIVRSIVDMCRALGIRTAAEHVEDDATMSLLRDYGVDFAQGYLVGKPKPVNTPHRSASASTGSEPVEPERELRAATG